MWNNDQNKAWWKTKQQAVAGPVVCDRQALGRAASALHSHLGFNRHRCSATLVGERPK